MSAGAPTTSLMTTEQMLALPVDGIDPELPGFRVPVAELFRF
jgi:hypothetical protein